MVICLVRFEVSRSDTDTRRNEGDIMKIKIFIIFLHSSSYGFAPRIRKFPKHTVGSLFIDGEN